MKHGQRQRSRPCSADNATKRRRRPKGRGPGITPPELHAQWLAWWKGIERKYPALGALVTGNDARFKDIPRLDRGIEWGLMLTRAYSVLDELPPYFRDNEKRVLETQHLDLTNPYASPDPRTRLARTKSVAKALAGLPGGEEVARTGLVPGIAYSYYDIEQLAEYLSDQVYRRKTGPLTQNELTRLLRETLSEARETALERFVTQLSSTTNLPASLQANMTLWNAEHRQPTPEHRHPTDRAAARIQ